MNNFEENSLYSAPNTPKCMFQTPHFWFKRWILFENDITFEIMNSIIINISNIYDEKTTKQISNYIVGRTKINK